MSEPSSPLFSDLQLSPAILRVLGELGYETPSPIQAATIPPLLAGRDVLGQAQTGTGKTAAFALPILNRLDTGQSTPQALVLAPTRELAIQVAEAFQRYATHLPGFHVLPIYGGQSYHPQLSALRRGVHVVVGTPGRVIDHLEKGSLDLSRLKTLVLDEADEMLRMGFIDDVETILQKTPASRQTALFSATMPPAIKRIAQTYLRDPAEVTIAAKTSTAENIRQRYWLVSGMHKLDALTRILEAEPFDGMIIFARTKLGTEELAGKLQARGFSATAINGDIQQQQRERTIAQLKEGKIDILVATDVAARGLDVERISHVINYDVPHDPESYTHRIGRTGRAGRSGEAILFITPRERNLLRVIERATRQPVSPLELPSIQAVNDVRIARFKDRITETLAAGGLETFQALIEDYEREHNVPATEIAAALARLARGDVPLLLDKNRREPQAEHAGTGERAPFERTPRGERSAREPQAERPAFPKKERVLRAPESGSATFRIEVGHVHGVKPGNIVGAVANEAGLDAKHIGRIEIYDDYSTLDLPDSIPDALLAHLKTVWVAGQQLRISRDGEVGSANHGGNAPARPDSHKPPGAQKTATPEKARHADVGMHAERFLNSPPPALDEASESVEPIAKPAPAKKERAAKKDVGVQAFRIEVGHRHAVKPANIVGAIANEAGLDAKYIGRIEIFEDYSVLDLPEGMPKEIFEQLKSVMVAGHPLRISRIGSRVPGADAGTGNTAAGGKFTLSAPKKGGDRRVEEKTSRGKKPGAGKVGDRSDKKPGSKAPFKGKPPRKGGQRSF